MAHSSRLEAAQELLHSVPRRLRKSGMLQLSDRSSVLTTGAALALGDDALSDSTAVTTLDMAEQWRHRLQKGELLAGEVVEICVTGPSLGTSVALSACRAAQQKARHSSGQPAWCAFVDPSRSLYAPGVLGSGVELHHLLVVRPDEENISRVALRLAESRIFPVMIVDLMKLPGTHHEVHLHTWTRVIRRLSLALENTQNTVVLLTEKTARRPLGLPVAQRIELSRASMTEMKVSIPRSPQGKYLPPTRIRWQRRDSTVLDTTRWSHVS